MRLLGILIFNIVMASVAVAASQHTLLLALREGDEERVKEYIKKGADLHHVGPYSALIVAIAEPDMVRFLIEQGVKLNEAKGMTFTPLGWAANRGYIDTVKVLLEKGADVNKAPAGEYPIKLAAMNGHAEIVKLLLAHRPSEESKTWALKYALENKHLDIAVMLQKAGAQLDLFDRKKAAAKVAAVK